MSIVPGSRCQIISVHHRCMNKALGRVVVVVKVLKNSVLAHDDKPLTYRTNRAGRRVVSNDPRCIQTFYGIEQLRLLPYGSLASY